MVYRNLRYYIAGSVIAIIAIAVLAVYMLHQSYVGSQSSTKTTFYTISPLLVEEARKEGMLSIISNIEDRAKRGIIEEFNKKYPFIKVTHIFLIPGQLQGRLEAEYRGGKITFDKLFQLVQALS